MTNNHVVICRANNEDEWEYVAATRRLFTAEGAAKYASTIHVALHPRIITAAEYLKSWQGWKEALE